jgi:type IV pilus assembly protein PilV
MKNKLNIPSSKMNGFSLLEVLIAVFILAIGLLGLINLQMTSIKNNQSALFRTSAIILSYDLIDRMRVNQAADYTLTMAATPSGATRKDTDLIAWTTALANTLPSGDGSVAFSGDIATITVQWDDSRGTQGSNLQSFAVSSQR